jgi:hypothetical protein
MAEQYLHRKTYLADSSSNQGCFLAGVDVELGVVQ